VDIAEDGSATNIVSLDIRGISSMTDYFVILTAESGRQMKALMEQMSMGLKSLGVRVNHKEGHPNDGWILLDFGDFIVHIFSPEKRDYYLLESAWPQAKELVRIF
jgi:ribosome-associated protein